METVVAEGWIVDWLWGLPLIVLAAIIHVLGLGVIQLGVEKSLSHRWRLRGRFVPFAAVVGGTVLAATALHGIEATVWAGAFVGLGALPDGRSAMLFSIGAMTTFGHSSLQLEDHWQMLGALEALNGMLLFGLTTAFLYATILNVRDVVIRLHNRDRDHKGV